MCIMAQGAGTPGDLLFSLGRGQRIGAAEEQVQLEVGLGLGTERGGRVIGSDAASWSCVAAFSADSC